MRTVGETIEVVRRWVIEEGSKKPGFAGAYLYGGINELALDALFPAYRDVDLVIVSTQGKLPQEYNLELDLDGVMLEVGFVGTDEHTSAEAVLADPGAGPNLAITTILADPDGFLSPLQSEVARDFAKRKWVNARCEAEKARAMDSLEALRHVDNDFSFLLVLWEAINMLCGTLALADLRKPTHRRSLTQAKEILVGRGLTDLHKELLRVWGSAMMTREQVQAMLGHGAAIFSEALSTYKTQTPLSFKLKPHLPPYFIEATQEIIDEGNHREATFWGVTPFGIGYMTILADGSEEQKRRWEPIWNDISRQFGFADVDAWPQRVASAEVLAEQLFTAADDIVAGNERIVG
jgi:hypothetical protein